LGKGYRVYYAKQSNVIVLLLCGGDKSTQQKDINQAKVYWQDYQERIK
jgi:putative addiction module killer protein